MNEFFHFHSYTEMLFKITTSFDFIYDKHEKIFAPSGVNDGTQSSSVLNDISICDYNK